MHTSAAPARLTREDIDAVIAIAEAGSVTRAAERLHLSQSALSHHLRGLEARLGGAVFERLPRGMAPTVLGEEFVRRARRLAADWRDAEEALAHLAGGRRIIRLGTECYTSYHWLPALAQDHGARVGEVELRIVLEATQRPVAALLAGEVDVAIVSSASEDARLTSRPLFRDETRLVVGAAHPLARRRRALPGDLADQILLLYATPGHRQLLVDEFLEPAGVRPREIRRVQLTEAILAMVRAGMGVSALARWAVEPHLQEQGLATLRLGGGLWRDWRLAWLRDHARSAEFVELARSLSTLLGRGRFAALGRG